MSESTGDTPKRYRVLARTVSVRKSQRKGSADYARFHQWRAGDAFEGYPPHTNIRYLLRKGAIEEVSA